MATLYIIQGFLGAGKSTYSKELAKTTGAVRLNADEWCVEHFPEVRWKNHWDECFGQSVEALWQEAEKLLWDGKSVILDLGFWSKESRDHARVKAHEWGFPLIHYYIHAPDDVLKARLAKRTGPIAENNLRNFDAIKKQFAEPQPGEHAIAVDNF